MTLVTLLTIFVLAMIVGLAVITKVPTLLHTPLMSGTNAIHGIVIVGALMAAAAGAGAAGSQTLRAVLGTLAIIAAMINVVGGFLVTDRMLRMFKSPRANRAGERKKQGQ
ncbi:MAG: NAD(P) transhydrogenase subunit alpha [Phycisphaerae bacterium]